MGNLVGKSQDRTIYPVFLILDASQIALTPDSSTQEDEG